MPVPLPHLILVKTTLETPTRAWIRRRSVVVPETPTGGPKSPELGRALPSRPAPPTGRPLGPSQARDTQVGPPIPQAARERLLRPHLLLWGGAQPPLPGLDA